MLRFAFWNLNGKLPGALLRQLTRAWDINVLILAECAAPVAALLQVLNGQGLNPGFSNADSNCDRIRVYCRFRSDWIRPLYETDHFTIRRLELPGSDPLLLAAAHLPSKLHWSDESQHMNVAGGLSERIRLFEEKVGHRRTIVVGDFNMDPFEAGMVGAGGMHGVATRAIASRGSRTVGGQEYPFLYNPMWACFGDSGGGPGGTYFHSSSQPVARFWHAFDQVLVRPELLDRFPAGAVRIIDRLGGVSLLNRSSRPDRTLASDHLPLVFELEL